MAIGPRLDIRQSQSLVMTPQLQQAIRLLTLSNLELESHIADAVADNPLLELGDTGEAAAPVQADAEMPDAGSTNGGDALDIAPDAADRDFDTGDGIGAREGSMGQGAASDGDFDFAERADDAATLAQHLHAQIGAAGGTAVLRFVAGHLIDHLDEAGYLVGDLGDIAVSLGIELDEAERALALLQTLDPTGAGARSLSECLALQAKEADRHDPCMAALLANLDLLAQGNLAHLRRICRVDDDDLADMIAELRRYDPKPGHRFGGGAATPVVPDVLIRREKGGWGVAINRRTLPRLVINRDYYVQMKRHCRDRAAQGWLGEKLSDANWLTRALDQRQRTILKVAHEIVRRQDGFFRRGVSALVPLTLREVAEKVELHESTISRVTSNKFLHCERGTFELKYFFGSGVAHADGEGGASAEAVKAAIRQLCDAEDPKKILSDDALVECLKDRGYTLARRTVAKYREAIGIGSSVQRRRLKRIAASR